MRGVGEMRGVVFATSLQGSVLVPDQQGAPALFKWPGLFNDSMSSRGLLLDVVKQSVVGLFGVTFGTVRPRPWRCALRERALCRRC